MKLVIMLLFLLVVNLQAEKKSIRIAISKGSGSDNYLKYAKYLQKADQSIDYVDLFVLPFDLALKEMENCDGMLLTGGPDVHPGRFGKEADSNRCSIDLVRDTLEFAIINAALERKMPILGICRGEQIMNVALGGSLIVDIPEDTDSPIIHQVKDSVANHIVNVKENSLLHKISSVKSYEVNSFHHQAVAQLAPELDAVAWTLDGLIEAIEWKNPNNKSWFLGIQWHPERLSEDNPLGIPLAKEFIKEVYKFKANSK